LPGASWSPWECSPTTTGDPTKFEQQWAAVTTHSELTMDPPQPIAGRYAIQFQLLASAAAPPTIWLDGPEMSYKMIPCLPPNS